MKVYLDKDGGKYTVFNSEVSIYGTSASDEEVKITSEVEDILISSTLEIANFVEDISNYQIKQGFGSNIEVLNLDGDVIAKIADVDNKQLIFNGISYTLKYNEGEVFIEGASDTLKLGKEPMSINIDGKSIGDIEPDPDPISPDLTGTDGDDIIIGTDGDDIIKGLDGNDIIRGGAGVDTMDGGSGDDKFVIVGDLSGGGKVDSDEDTEVLGSPLTDLNFKDLNEDEDGAEETILGGDGDDTLYIYGITDISNDKIESIENIKLRGDVTIDGNSLKDILNIEGDGNSSTIRIVNDEPITIDLSSIKLDRIGEINLSDNITIKITNLDDLGDARKISGNGTIIITESDIKEIPDTYTVDNDIKFFDEYGNPIKVGGRVEIPEPPKDPGTDIEGTDGDDYLEGDSADNTILTGDGDDTLIGGAGNDTYIINGNGKKIIIDSNGDKDTIDLSDLGNSANIDLSKDGKVGEDTEIVFSRDSHKEPLDLLILQDLSGSFRDDVSTVRGLLDDLTTDISEIQPDTYFGAASFVDKPVEGHGSGSDFVYHTDAKLTSDTEAIKEAFNNMTVLGGDDSEEAQLEALYQVALRTIEDEKTSGTAEDEIGFRENSMKIVLITTDAPYHVEGDYVGATSPNNGDTIVDSYEDYPNIDMVKEALAEANIIPIFAVTSNVTDYYKELVSELGRGDVVKLETDSSNLIEAISNVLNDSSSIEADSIENVIGTDYDDVLIGNSLDNDISGGNGDDVMAGKDGNDTLTGGNGADSFIFYSKEDGIDTIQDFELGVDKIKVSSSEFTSLDNFTFNSDTNELSYDGATLAVLTGVSEFDIHENIELII